jgi:hypothetical protein
MEGLLGLKSECWEEWVRGPQADLRLTRSSIYEFIQRRSDWKKIEKTVDKAMYALSVKEDCVIM